VPCFFCFFWSFLLLFACPRRRAIAPNYLHRHGFRRKVNLGRVQGSVSPAVGPTVRRDNISGSGTGGFPPCPNWVFFFRRKALSRFQRREIRRHFVFACFFVNQFSWPPTPVLAPPSEVFVWKVPLVGGIVGGAPHLAKFCSFFFDMFPLFPQVVVVFLFFFGLFPRPTLVFFIFFILFPCPVPVHGTVTDLFPPPQVSPPPEPSPVLGGHPV